jgi:hypothetical protein
MSVAVPDDIIDEIRKKIIIPLKDAMRVSEYKEHDRNYKFYNRKKTKNSSKALVFRSYSFKIKGILKHEMYLKPINAENIINILGSDFDYKLIMKPNKPIDLEFESRNKRSIELVIYLKKIDYAFLDVEEHT